MDVLQHFRHARRIESIPQGATLFKAGDAPDFMYVLMEGQANVMVGRIIVEIAGPGSLIGEMALVDRAPRSATVVARTLCRVVPIDPAHFNLLIHETPAFGRHVMAVMAGRLRRMNENLNATQAIGGVNIRVIANTSRSLEEADERSGARPWRGETRPS
jgi:CRP/FNR family transcriptional regulator, cyclic AMP receptor protein